MFNKIINNQRLFIRNIDSKSLLDGFFVSAIASILVIRCFLHLTGYPIIGGGNWHIAHMLFGGIFMLSAMILVFISLSRMAKAVAASLGGIGFGMFIDELGKFITMDNDYFFQPTIALLYVIFILLYLWFRSLEPQRAKLSEQECLANALELTKEAVIDDIDQREKQRALSLIKLCKNNVPTVQALRVALEQIQTMPSRKPSFYIQARQMLGFLYWQLVRKKWFSRAVVAFFIFSSIITLFQSVLLIKGVAGLVLSAMVIGMVIIGFFHSRKKQLSNNKLVVYITLLVIFVGVFRVALKHIAPPALSLVEWGELTFSIFSGILVVIGILRIQRSRLAAYKMFERAILISIFLTQFFAFYQDQLSAVFGLFWNIIILTTLQYWMRQEESI